MEADGLWKAPAASHPYGPSHSPWKSLPPSLASRDSHRSHSPGGKQIEYRAKMPKRNVKREKPRRSFPAHVALEHAASLINRVNLDFLWRLCTRLSIHDLYTPYDYPFSAFPLLNPEDIRHFGQVIIASRAGFCGQKELDGETFRRVLNDCKDMLDDPEARNRLARANGTAGAHLALQLVLSQIANIQFPAQAPRPQEKIGRLVALLEALPRRFPEKIPADHAESARELASTTAHLLGLPLSALATCFFAAIQWTKLAYLHSTKVLSFRMDNPALITDSQMRQWGLVLSLLVPEDLSGLKFTAASMANLLAKPAARDAFLHSFGHFLRHFSGSTSDLRALSAQQSFQVGHLSGRLSPLERFPIVRLEEPPGREAFTIPNAAHFLNSFSPVIDYMLIEKVGPSYSQVRGAMLEVYVRCLLEDRQPALLLIPERTYGREERRGPDLTLIDRELKKIVLVEIKGRRIKLETRLTMTEDGLRENLEDAHAALLKLPKKLEELYSGRPEYSDLQPAIDETKGCLPVFVVVLSEGVYQMGELARKLGESPGDSLYGYKFPYCILALDIFEHAVEMARIRKKALVDLLYEHWEQSLRRDYQSASADMFGGSRIPESETYAGGFVPWE
jgi:hypothetical protein